MIRGMDGRPDNDREWRIRWSLGSLHFLVIVAFTWARIVRDGTLLSRVQVEWIPWLTGAVLLATGLLTPLLGRFTRIRTPARAFAGVTIATGVSLLAWELLQTRSAWSAMALYVWVGAYGPLLVAQFWLLVQQSLDAEQARRHIGWIGAFGILGGIASGLTATLITRSISLDELLGLTAVAQLAAGALAMGRAAPPAPLPDEVPAANKTRRARTVLREVGYARLLALVVVAGALTGGLVDYQFKLALQRQSTDPAALGQWLGLFNVAASGLALLTQLAVGVLLTRVGSRLLAFVLPAGVITAASAGLAWPGTWPPVAARLWETASRHSVARTSQEFFFFPLQGAPRTTMKHAAEGFLTRAGEVGASLLLVLLAFVGRADPWHLSLAVVIACGGWMCAIAWLGQAYGPALSRSLDALLLPGRTAAPGDVDRGVAVPELIGLLRSRDPRHVVFALDELGAVDPARARREARSLLAHRAPAVRARARRATAPRRNAPSTPTLDGWQDAGVLQAALRSGNRTRALAACAEVVAHRERHAVPVLLANLSGAMREAVRNTLVQLGDDAVGILGDTLADARVPLRVRRDVAVVLGRIATPAALAQLWRVPRSDARQLQGVVLRSLDAARKAGLPVLLDETAVRQDIEADLVEFDLRRRQAAALVDEPSAEVRLLVRALAEAASQARERVFRRLALIYPAREMLRAHRGLTSPEDRIRAFALQYLEASLTQTDRDLLLPVLRTHVPAEATAASVSVIALASDDDTWIATLALHVLGSRRDAALRHAVSEPLRDDAVYQETARWALARL
jgi:ATP/ADP translocase